MTYTHPKRGGEWQPFNSWTKAKQRYGIKADGSADDTAGVQDAFNDLKGATLFEDGKYNITKKIVLEDQTIIDGRTGVNGKVGVKFMGTHPTKTIFHYHAKGDMFHMQGLEACHFGRFSIVGLGKDKGQCGINQSSTGWYDTSNKYEDIWFYGLKNPFKIGFAGRAGAESPLIRFKMFKCGDGITTGNYNSLNIWIRQLETEDCDCPVSNYGGAGNFKIYDGHFKRSLNSDIYCGEAGVFYASGCLSKDSKKFFYSEFSDNPSPTTLLRNIILDPTAEDYCIDFKKHGALHMFGNYVRLRAGKTMHTKASHEGRVNLIAAGNTSNVKGVPYLYDRAFITPDKYMVNADFNKLPKPIIDPVPENLNRPVVEVVGNNVQAAINEADKLYRGKRPIVHFTGNVTADVIIPGASDVQVMSDTRANVLTGIINIPIRCKATVKDFFLQKGGINIIGVDKEGDRVFLDLVNCANNGTGESIVGLSKGKVVHENSNIAYNKIGYTVVNSHVLINGGSQGKNDLVNYFSGGFFHIGGIWYEAETQGYLHAVGDGTVILDTSNVTGSAISRNKLPEFKGTALFINSESFIRMEVKGVKDNVLLLSCIVDTDDTPVDNFFSQRNIRPAGDFGSTENINDTKFNAQKVLKAVALLMSVRIPALEANADDLSDVRLENLNIGGCPIGVNIVGGNAPFVQPVIPALTVAAGTIHAAPRAQKSKPTPIPAGKGWVQIGREGSRLWLKPGTKLRYGVNPNWAYGVAPDKPFVASNEFFGGDPIFGKTKFVYVWVEAGM